MRKYRGKRIDGKGWVEGLPFYSAAADVWTMYPIDGTRGLPVDPETVSQETGLTDKNGNMIFEGDMIKHTNGLITSTNEIGYAPGHFYMKGFWSEENAMVNEEYFKRQSEVIGNKWDNPELIKE